MRCTVASPSLSREQFSAAVLALLAGRCAVPHCPHDAVEAHHLLNRNLWVDGGYYVANGAPLCSEHHLAAERTTLSVSDLRTWCGHTESVLPAHLDASGEYDTWGNAVHADGTRSPGEMYFTDPCQAALKAGGVLHLFDLRVRYPRTMHLPDSPGRASDDKVIRSLEALRGTEVVVTEKLDGGNVTWMTDAFYARSLDSNAHPSQNFVKALWAARRHDIPHGWRISGEDLYARRSVSYESLPGYFVVFGVWDHTNTLLCWDETLEWAELLDLPAAPVLYRGSDLRAARAAWSQQRVAERSEGFVVRDAGSIPAAQFTSRVAKWVRAEHVRTSADWRHRDDFAVNALA